MVVHIFLVVLVTAIVFAVVVLRKLSQSRTLMTGVRMTNVQLKTMVEYSETQRELSDARQGVAVEMAANSVEMTREALDVAHKIDQVAGQVDVLFGLATRQVPEVDPHGRHLSVGFPDQRAIGRGEEAGA